MIATEHQEQKAFTEYMNMAYKNIPWYAIPNGGKRDAITGKQLKDTGVKAGVPDICIPVPRGQYHGLYIELKRTKKSAISVAQKCFMNDLEFYGYKCVVAYGATQAIEAVKQYFKGKTYE